MTKSHKKNFSILAITHIKKFKFVYLFLAACLVTATYWYFYSQYYLSTDDAYINTDVVQISPLANGTVIKIYVTNNQQVKPGDKLFDIDPSPYQLAVDQAQAQLGVARQTMEQATAAIEAAKAQVASQEAQLADTKLNTARILAIVNKHLLAVQDGDNAKAALAKDTAALAAAKANLAQAESNLGKAGDDNEQIKLATAALKQAQLNLSYTQVTAPNDGTVANFTLRVGDVVQAGLPNQPLFALINKQDYWVDANFKETDLQHIKTGQKAHIEVDMYPDHIFKGVVESISGGSGTAFSLLPPENATGNWVKVTQRVPVRIRIVEPDPQFPLRIGTTASVTLHLKES